jgi:hypothetical protein
LSFHHRLYLHYFDRELGESVHFTPDESLIRSVTSCLLLANPAGLYCGLSPVWETTYENDPVVQYVAGLALGGHLSLMSNHPTTREFVNARQGAYSHDQDRYPMYFCDNFGALEALPLTPKFQSATQFLRNDLSAWASDPPQDLFLAFPDKTPRTKLLRAVSLALNKRDHEAVTYALFDGRLRLFNHDTEFDSRLRREISRRYTRHNCDDGGDIPTGIKGLFYYDRLSDMFPFYDVPLLSCIVAGSGAGRLESQGLWEPFLAIRGKDEHLLYCDKLRAFVCGLCGEAGVGIPSPAAYGSRNRLVQAARRNLYESTRHDLPAETARDVLLASIEKLNRAIERGQRSGPFAEAAEISCQPILNGQPPANSTALSISPPGRWKEGPRLYREDGRWTGDQLRRLREELLAVFPSRGQLDMLVSDSLSRNMDEFATTENLEEAVHQLCKWMNVDPLARLRPLVLRASQVRPNSTTLNKLVAELPAEQD